MSLNRARHPGGVAHRKPGGAGGFDDREVVIDKKGDGRLAPELAQFAHLHDRARSTIVLGPHHQPAGRQFVLIKPQLGCRAKPFGPAGEIHDAMRRRSTAREFDALREHVVVVGGGEKRRPVLPASGNMVEAVSHVGEYSVDIENDDLCGHAADTTDALVTPPGAANLKRLAHMFERHPTDGDAMLRAVQDSGRSG
jgi:hypothetical protein